MTAQIIELAPRPTQTLNADRDRLRQRAIDYLKCAIIDISDGRDIEASNAMSDALTVLLRLSNQTLE